jgi:glycosyltransferase involved in cell wall biosynthesis
MINGQRIIPILMVCNEEYWIGRVVDALLRVFTAVVVGDTGSEDRTRDILIKKERVHLLAFGRLQAKELGGLRGELARYAKEKLAAELVMQVDGDELYRPDDLYLIAQKGLPKPYRAGFAALTTLDFDGRQVWTLEDTFSRLAIFSPDETWIGEYPFEFPSAYQAGSRFFYYYSLRQGYREHGYHLHRLPRSPLDETVLYRKRKQHLFSLQEKAVKRVMVLPDFPLPWKEELSYA